MHDCEVHHYSGQTQKKKNHQPGDDLQVDNEDCFICTFDLGFYSKSEFTWLPVKQNIKVPYVAKRVELVTNDSYSLNQLRGPPSIA